jgi:hypothetical protein
MDLMAAGEWERGTTAERLAEEWGLCQTEIDRTAAELSKAAEPMQLGAGVAAAKLILESHGLLTQHHRVSVDQPRNEAAALAELMADPVWGPKIRAYVTTGEPVLELPAGEKDEES